MTALISAIDIAYILVNAQAEHFQSLDFELYEASRAAGFPLLVYDKSLRDCIVETCGERRKEWIEPLFVLASNRTPEMRAWIQHQFRG